MSRNFPVEPAKTGTVPGHLGWAMNAGLVEMLTSPLSPAERIALLELGRVLDVDDEGWIVDRLVWSDGVYVADAIRRYIADAAERDVPDDDLRLVLGAVGKVTSKAHELGQTEYAVRPDVFLPRLFREPPRGLRSNGGDRRSREYQHCDLSMRYGTVDYFLARLKRDRPDLLRAYRSGELASVRQAAIEAGFIKPRERPRADGRT